MPFSILTGTLFPFDSLAKVRNNLLLGKLQRQSQEQVSQLAVFLEGRQQERQKGHKDFPEFLFTLLDILNNESISYSLSPWPAAYLVAYE